MDGLSSGTTTVTTATLSTEDTTEEVDARLWYVDSESGHVWQRVTLEGDDPAEDMWQDQGLLVPPSDTGPGDGADPLPVTGLTCVSVYQQQDDGTSLPVISCTWDLLVAEDIIGYELEWQAGLVGATDPEHPELPPAYDPPDFVTPQSRRVGRDVDFAVLSPVLGGRVYDVRIRGYDAEARVGPWALDDMVFAQPDDVAPDIPDPSAYAGYEMMGIRWNAGTESDLDHYEVRYRKVGDPDWEVEETRATVIVIGDLVADTDYEANVRAVDSSGNVRTSDVDPTAVRPGDAAYDTAGWSITVFATPTLVGQADIVFTNAIISGILDAGTINAKYIETGTISVGGDVDSPVGIRVYDTEGRPIGAWGAFGWIIADPVNSNRAIWATPEGELKFTAEYEWDGTETLDTANPDPDRRDEVLLGIEQGLPDDVTLPAKWTTALSADGINAEAITFGAVGGGHNKVLNAGFELISFASAAVSAKQWDVTADWDDATSAVNLSVSTGDLKMTAV